MPAPMWAISGRCRRWARRSNRPFLAKSGRGGGNPSPPFLTPTEVFMARSLLALGLLALAPAALAEPLAVDLKTTALGNRTAYIPSQCYTKTEDASGRAHNPCFTCHVQSRAPHYKSGGFAAQPIGFIVFYKVTPESLQLRCNWTKWCPVSDSNRLPQLYKGRALPGELTGPHNTRLAFQSKVRKGATGVSSWRMSRARSRRNLSRDTLALLPRVRA